MKKKPPMVIVREWTNNNISIICVCLFLKKKACVFEQCTLFGNQAANTMAYFGLTPFLRNKHSKILFEFTGICNNHVFALIGFQWLLTAVLWVNSQTVSLLHAAIVCFESDEARRGEKLFWKRLSSISSRTGFFFFLLGFLHWETRRNTTLVSSRAAWHSPLLHTTLPEPRM